MKKYRLIDNFRGYFNKRDITNIASNVLVAPSKNVIINDSEKISTRKGYKIFGVSEGEGRINYSYDWLTSFGYEINLRVKDKDLQFLRNKEWITIKEDLPSKARFDTWWDNTESLDYLLFVCGDSNIYAWSGGIATFKEATDTTITKEGDENWAESRFLSTKDKKVILGGIEYTYTGGEDTDTLTGVSPDPTQGTHEEGDLIYQAIVVNADKPGDKMKNTLLKTMYNQIYVSDETKPSVFISSVTDYTDFVLTSPRKPGDPAVLTLDSPPSGFIPQEDSIYISGKRDEWYQVSFNLTNDLMGEQVDVVRLKTAPGQGALSQEAIEHIKNNVVFISNEPTLDTLGRLEGIDTPQSTPLSDPIKLDFDSFDFTDTDVRYFKNNLYIAVPKEGVILIYDIENQRWQPPQVIPVSCFMVKDNKLYGHSSVESATYELFVGSNDNGLPIHSMAVFSYRNYGDRMLKKTMTEWATEGYIEGNTKLILKLNYDYGGYTTNKEKIIDGGNEKILFQPFIEAGIGKSGFGKQPIGSSLVDESTPSKFRVINEFTADSFFELQPIYESYGVDQKWELIAFGGNIFASPHDSIEIKY